MGLRGSTRVLIWGCLALGAVAALPSSAVAARPLETGFADTKYASSDDATRELWFDRTEAAGAGIVRLTLSWRTVTTGKPADPTDPADPAYDFSDFDAAIRSADSRGLGVLLTSYHAPNFAVGADRPPDVRPGSWRPDADEYGAFAIALATRYSGSFNPPGAEGKLPRVRYFQAWNEPNIAVYLTPQWKGDSPVSPSIYRELLNAFYEGVVSVHHNNQVVVAGTSPYGDPPGGPRVRPLVFWRRVLCLRARKGGKLRSACDERSNFNVFAHHPIGASKGPRKRAVHRDDATTSDLHKLRRVLRRAEKLGHVQPRGRSPIWATEFWWESRPPDSTAGVPQRRHARWIALALYLIWKQGATAAINLQAGDSLSAERRDEPYQAGVYFSDGRPKRALRAFRFPFVTERRSRKRLRAWGKSPLAGRVRIQRLRGARWKTLESERVKAGETFKARLRFRGGARMRAKVRNEKSLTWKQGARVRRDRR